MPEHRPDVVARFIPTHVGNTLSMRRASTFSSVHPHPCGERPQSYNLWHQTAGSSPPVWGTHQVLQVCMEVVRFIPTHMGNTSPPQKASGSDSGHPRPRGEHGTIPMIAYGEIGSSPPRGEHVTVPATPYAVLGSSPRVGNTLLVVRHGMAKAVHPYPRGEHPPSGVGYRGRGGSSPRPWGTPGALGLTLLTERFIPTGAGNTKLPRSMIS